MNLLRKDLKSGTIFRYKSSKEIFYVPPWSGICIFRGVRILASDLPDLTAEVEVLEIINNTKWGEFSY